jgi:hypothetical protein
VIARALGGLPEVGDGIVARTCAEIQRRYWSPPDLSRAAGASKWREDRMRIDVLVM